MKSLQDKFHNAIDVIRSPQNISKKNFKILSQIMAFGAISLGVISIINHIQSNRRLHN